MEPPNPLPREDVVPQPSVPDPSRDFVSFPEQNPNPVMRLDKDGRVAYANGPARRLLEGLGWAEGQAAPEALAARVRSAGGAGAGLELDCPGGRILAFSLTGDGSGGLNLYGVDVTQRRLAQRDLHAAGSFVRQVLESISDAFYAVDRDWRFTYVNRKACVIWNKKPEDLVGKALWEVFPHVRGTMAYEKMVEAMDSGRPCRFENYSSFLGAWVDVSLHPSESGLSVYFHDISERKQVEAAREQNARRFELLAETAGELLRNRDPQKAVDSLCRRVLEQLDCQVFFNYLLDPGTGRLRLNAWAGIPAEEASRIGWLDLGAAVCGCVARDGAPIVAERIQSTPDPRTDLVRAYGVQAYACHPLRDSDGRMLGTLSFGSRGRDHFGPDDLSLMRAVTDLVSVGMARIRSRRELERQAARLEESEQRLRLAQEASRLGIWVYDVPSGSVHWDARLRELWGVEPDAPVDYGLFLSGLHSGDKARIEAAVAASLDPKGDGRYCVEYRCRNFKTGAWHWEAVVGQTTFVHGRAAMMIGTTQDVTERKQAEDALRRSEEKLRLAKERLEQRIHERTAELSKVVGELQTEVLQRRRAETELQRTNRALRMLSACNEAVVRVDDEERLMREVCRVAVDVGGYRMAWVGVPRGDEAKSVRPLACTDVESGYLQSIQVTWGDDELGRGPTGTAIRLGTVQVGTDFLNEPRLAPWREQALKAGFRSSIALPLKQGRQVFGALNIYAAERAAFDGAQQRVLVELAEDLASGVTALRMRAALRESRDRLRILAGELTTAEQRERQRLAKFLHDHLQQLLVGAKFRAAVLGRAGGEEVGKGAEEVQTLLDEAIAASRSLTAELCPPILHEGGLKAGLEWLARWMADKHGLAVDLSVEDGLPRLSDGPRVVLFEAVRELLFNAVKHAKVRSASVDARAAEGREVRVTVSDAGRGFDPAKPAPAVKGSGGMGLFSVRERLDLVGGGMVIESVPGRGSRVTLTVPAEPAEEPRGPAVAAERPAVRAGRPRRRAEGPRIRVLLADDHAVMREGLSRLLGEEPDIEVVGEAVDGRKAVELAGTLAPDVVLMDISMPGLNGVEATRAIRGEYPDVRVIGLSMFEEAERSRAMREAGAVQYLTKTGPAADLVAAIRAAGRGRTPAPRTKPFRKAPRRAAKRR